MKSMCMITLAIFLQKMKGGLRFSRKVPDHGTNDEIEYISSRTNK